MLDLLTNTGLGSCLMILTAFIGIPAAYWWDTKKMPGAVTPGETVRKSNV